MNIALMAHDRKKELMTQFCTAYCGILAQHTLCATSTTGQLISDATGLSVHRFLSFAHGGGQQIGARIAYNEIDVVFYFRSTDPMKDIRDYENTLLRLCDVHNVPVATNIATAEIIVTALERGELDYRNFINPRSEYNIKKRNIKY